MCVIKQENGRIAHVGGIYNAYDLVKAIDEGCIGNPISATIGNCKYNRKDFAMIRNEMKVMPLSEE